MIEKLNLEANTEFTKTFENPISKIAIKVISGGTVYVKDTTVELEDSKAFKINLGERTLIHFWDISELNFISDIDTVVEIEVENDLELTQFTTVGIDEKVIDLKTTTSNVFIRNLSETATIYLALNREADIEGVGTYPLLPKNSIDGLSEECNFLHMISTEADTKIYIKINTSDKNINLISGEGDAVKKLDEINTSLKQYVEGDMDTGIATGGTVDSLTDTSAVWIVDDWKGARVEILINGKRHFASVLSNTADTLAFANTLAVAVTAGCAYKIKLFTVQTQDVRSINGVNQTPADWTVLFQDMKNYIEALKKLAEGLSGYEEDEKPTENVLKNTEYFEFDTQKTYIFNGIDWTEITSGDTVTMEMVDGGYATDGTKSDVAEQDETATATKMSFIKGIAKSFREIKEFVVTIKDYLLYLTKRDRAMSCVVTLVRPNDSIAYTANDLIANSTVAGEVVPLEFDFTNAIPGSVLEIKNATVASDNSPGTPGQYYLHLFNTPPVSTVGDNALFNVIPASTKTEVRRQLVSNGYKNVDSQFVDSGSSVLGITMTLAEGSTKFYGLLQSNSTPSTQKEEDEFTIRVEMIQR